MVGQTQQVEVDLRGGQVTTLTFRTQSLCLCGAGCGCRSRRNGRIGSAGLRPLPTWRSREIYLAADRDWLEGGPLKWLHVAQEHDKQSHVFLFVTALQNPH